MPILRKNIIEPEAPPDDYDESTVEEALRESGSVKGLEPTLVANGQAVSETEDIDEVKFRKILNRNGASIAQASRTIARIMSEGKYENSQLRAAELVLDLQGIRDKEGKLQKQAVFNFVINDGSVNVNQIFAPNRPSIASLSSDLAVDS